MQANRTATCEHCGASFVPKRQTKGRFCSAQCYRIWWRENGQREYSKRGLERLIALRAEGRDPRASDQATWKRRMAFRDSAIRLEDADGMSDDDVWAERASYWGEVSQQPEPPIYLRKPKTRRPLVLSGHGVRICVDKGTLLVQDGLTKHPQSREERRFFPGDPRIPARVVLVDVPGGSVTFDALTWLVRQSVPLIQLDWRGRVAVTIGPATTTDAERRDAQIQALHDGRGFSLAAWLVAEKLGQSLSTLKRLPGLMAALVAIGRVDELRRVLLDDPPDDVGGLMLIEAQAAATYFAAWQDVPLRWRDTGRRPIPPEWQRMPLRQSLLGGSNRTRATRWEALSTTSTQLLSQQSDERSRSRGWMLTFPTCM
jgi:hypothetical protein